MIVDIYQMLPSKKKLLIMEENLSNPDFNLPIGENDTYELVETADTQSKTFKYNARQVEKSVVENGYHFLSFI